MTSVIVAARRRLLTESSVTDLLGSGRDSTRGASSANYDSWLFPEKLFVTLKGTGKAAIVLNGRGAWTTPNQHNTAQFPRLIVDIYSDPERDDIGNIKRHDATDRAWKVYEAIDPVLHRPTGFQEFWAPDYRVYGSVRLDEPDVFQDVPDMDGTKLVRLVYGVSHG